MIDVSIEEHAYFIGFIQGDGSLSQSTRNRGKLRIERGYRDKNILDKISTCIKADWHISTRTRSTNFKDNYKCCTLTVHTQAFSKELVDNGVPYGRKSDIIRPPSNRNLNKEAYLRGLIDADGSLGTTKTGKPFISLCTKSEYIKDYYLLFIQEHLGYKPLVKKNKRDDIYNIMIMGTRSQTIIKCLYSNAKIVLERKRKESTKALSWKRSSDLRAEAHPKRWNKLEDDYILSHTTEEAIYHLGRSPQSIGMRKWRLSNI